jgi:hypothetical protein
LLARPGDRDAFVAHTQLLAADAVLRSRLRAQAALVGAGLSWPRVIDDLEAVFRHLIARRQAGDRAGSATFLRAEGDRAPS